MAVFRCILLLLQSHLLLIQEPPQFVLRGKCVSHDLVVEIAHLSCLQTRKIDLAVDRHVASQNQGATDRNIRDRKTNAAADSEEF